jgi:hypothetical protein
MLKKNLINCKQTIWFYLFIVLLSLIIIFYLLHYFFIQSYSKYNNLLTNEFTYVYPENQIAYIPELILFYNFLEKYNDYGLTIPVGLIHCKVLLLLNIATTKSSSINYPIYFKGNKNCTMQLIEKSLGGYEIMKEKIEEGELSILDNIPIRMSNKDHILDISDSYIDKCLKFNLFVLLPIVQPKYVFGFGSSSKKMLDLLYKNNELFTIQTNKQNNITIYTVTYQQIIKNYTLDRKGVV